MISILKKNQPVAVQNRINGHIETAKKEARLLRHDYSTQALNVVGLTALQDHPDAWRNIFHKDDQITKQIWDRTHREISSQKQDNHVNHVNPAAAKIRREPKKAVGKLLPLLNMLKVPAPICEQMSRNQAQNPKNIGLIRTNPVALSTLALPPSFIS